MKAGPKAAVDDSVLPLRPRPTGSARFAKFGEKFVKVPKGTGARSPLLLRPWKVELVARCWTPRPSPAPPDGCCLAGKESRR